jgi:hypothetical protein
MDTSKAAAIAVGIAFAIGVLYNYGYFVGLDLNFFTFLSYKDHLTTLVLFVPPSLLMALFFGVYRRKIRQLDYVSWRRWLSFPGLNAPGLPAFRG